jgi:hypothetical protein
MDVSVDGIRPDRWFILGPAILLLQPEAKAQVVVLTGDFPAGHVLADADMEVRELPVPF